MKMAYVYITANGICTVAIRVIDGPQGHVGEPNPNWNHLAWEWFQE